MELYSKLIAAADMAQNGEELNLDEISFLLRYAADELNDAPEIKRQRDRLLDRYRNRLLARCDLLERTEEEATLAKEGSLNELETLDERLDLALQQRYPVSSDGGAPSGARAEDMSRFHSGK